MADEQILMKEGCNSKNDHEVMRPMPFALLATALLPILPQNDGQGM